MSGRSVIVSRLTSPSNCMHHVFGELTETLRAHYGQTVTSERLSRAKRYATGQRCDECGRVWPSVIECGRVWSNVTECGRVWLSVTSPTAAMCCLNADSNNNAVQSRCSCFSTFRDWIQRIGMRSRGWRDDLPHSLVVVQIILSTVKPCASLSTIIRFHVLLTKRSFHRLMYFKCLKSLYLIWNKLMLFYLPSSLTNKCTIY